MHGEGPVRRWKPGPTQPPAFQLYARDFLTDGNVALMTATQVGLYVRLLCHCWLQGSLPPDLKTLATLAGVPASALIRHWPSIAPCFDCRPDDGALISPMLEERRRSQAAYRDRSAVGGRAKADREREIRNNSPEVPQIGHGLGAKAPSEPGSAEDPGSPKAGLEQEFGSPLAGLKQGFGSPQAGQKQGLGRSLDVPDFCSSSAPSSASAPAPASASDGVTPSSTSTALRPVRRPSHVSPLGDVPAFLHDEFVRKVANGGLPPTEAEQEVRRMYSAVEEEWRGRIAAEDPVKFWRARFTESVGATQGPSRAGSAVLRAMRGRNAK